MLLPRYISKKKKKKKGKEHATKPPKGKASKKKEVLGIKVTRQTILKRNPIVTVE